MNMFAKLALTAAFAALLIPGVAAAQETSQVGAVNGNAMASHAGSEYTPLNTGDTIAPGDAVMVSPNSSVVLNVTDGTRSWTVTLPPGTYRITPGLLRTASGAPIASQATGNLAFTVGAIVGTAALAAAGVEGMGDDIPPVDPVSQ